MIKERRPLVRVKGHSQAQPAVASSVYLRGKSCIEYEDGTNSVRDDSELEAYPLTAKERRLYEILSAVAEQDDVRIDTESFDEERMIDRVMRAVVEGRLLRPARSTKKRRDQ